MKAVIIGAGIGGLTAALCLARRGWAVEVLEQAPAIAEVGAGVQISPNGMKAVAALGLAEALARAAFEPERLEMRLGRSGRRVFSLPQGAYMRGRYGAPYLQIHRADLIGVLADALAERAPGALKTGMRVAGYEQGEGGAAAALSDGAAIEGDLIVGADGVHSVIREAMLGPDRPRFTGNVAWRALAPRSALAGHEATAGAGACVWVGPGRHAVTYPVRGGALINFVGLVEQDGWEVESWSEPGAPAAVRADFDGWAPPLMAIIDGIEAPFRWALHDRAPLPRWSDGRVALLGDACHPMLPSLAQGACQSIEDAWTLAAAVEEATDGAGIGAALTRYHAARGPRTARVQRAAADNLRLFHRRGAAAQALTYGPAFLAGLAAPAILHNRYAWVYGHDVTAGFA